MKFKFAFGLIFAFMAFLTFASPPKPPPKDKICKTQSDAPKAVVTIFTFSADLPMFSFYAQPTSNAAPNYFRITPKSVNVPKLRKSEGRKQGLSHFRFAKERRNNLSNANADFKVGWQVKRQA